MRRDRRGALLLAAIGALAIFGALVFLFTWAQYDTFPAGSAALGFGLLATVAGAVRHSRGQPAALPKLPFEELRRTRPGAAHNFRRVISFLLDAGTTFAIGAAILIGFDELLPRSSGQNWIYAADGHRLVGGEVVRAALGSIQSSDAQLILGPLAIALLAGGFLLFPAAVWGATPGMLLLRLRWVRSADGGRPGACQACARAFFGLILAPLNAALIFVAVVLNGSGRASNNPFHYLIVLIRALLLWGQERPPGVGLWSSLAGARRCVGDGLLRTDCLGAGDLPGPAAPLSPEPPAG